MHLWVISLDVLMTLISNVLVECILKIASHITGANKLTSINIALISVLWINLNQTYSFVVFIWLQNRSHHVHWWGVIATQGINVTAFCNLIMTGPSRPLNRLISPEKRIRWRSCRFITRGFVCTSLNLSIATLPVSLHVLTLLVIWWLHVLILSIFHRQTFIKPGVKWCFILPKYANLLTLSQSVTN